MMRSLILDELRICSWMFLGLFFNISWTGGSHASAARENISPIRSIANICTASSASGHQKNALSSNDIKMIVSSVIFVVMQHKTIFFMFS